MSSITAPEAEFRSGGAVLRRLRPTRHTGATPLRVAVSGGIGAGKSTFAQALKPYALAYADADEIARDIVQPGQPALAAIAQRFGAQVIHTDGSLNRAALASIIFSDEDARAALEAITHPAIRQRSIEILTAPEGEGFVVYDIPLLRTPDEAKEFDEVVIVSAPLEDRLARLEQRGMTREDALARIDAQMSDEERETLATIVIDNQGSVSDMVTLAQQAAQMWGADLAEN